MRLGVIAAAVWQFAAVAAAADVDYTRDIKPLLSARCYSCHSSLWQKSNLRLDTAEFIRKGGELGPSISPGKSGESYLYQAITGTEGMIRMPPDGEGAPLEPDQIALVKRWIDSGAKSPADEKPLDDPRDHWAFRPPLKKPLPEVAGSSASQNLIDAFLSVEHQKQGLTPLPPAGKAVLLRRVYLDLIGLPPTREQLHAFLDDASPDAYSKVVDSLLASPQYGERWGRHWMDVWRYSDWYGRRRELDVRNSYPHIWRWRDWIVGSLNDDKGYDRMVTEMLAGDEIAPEDDATIAATGFIVRNWFSLNYDQWMRDMVEHTGKAFLGLRFNCALCHDHKYDPITQQEYFQLRAFFEPLELRQDRVPGGPPLAKYLRYKVGSGASLKPIEAGLARVYEEYPDQQTYMYRGGDMRQKFEDKPPVVPGTPAALGGKLPTIEPVKLSNEASYPGLKPWVQKEELEQRETELKAAEAALAEAKKQQAEQLATREHDVPLAEEEFVRWSQHADEAGEQTQAALDRLRYRQNRVAVIGLAVATAEVKLADAKNQLTAVKAVIAADQVKYGRAEGNFDELAVVAVKAQRAATLSASEAGLRAAELNLCELRIKNFEEPAKPLQLGKIEAALANLKAANAKLVAEKPAETQEYAGLSPSYRNTSTGRRTALAAWLTARDNPLTARVAVNHIWARHFGRPLVASVYDFGKAGKLPTHPELLDWLAVELMEYGWSMKHLHRVMVTSAAYCRSSSASAGDANLEADKENQFWWRAERRRMEAEVVRDGLLFVAGQLDLTPGGQEVDNTQAMTSRRRSMYFTVHPEDGGQTMLAALFDAPDPCECYRRTETLVPQQALALVNSQLSQEMSRTVAANLQQKLTASASPDAREFIGLAFEQILSRAPRHDELAACQEFLAQQQKLYVTTDANASPAQAAARAQESLVRVLFNHHDWVTIH